MIGKAGKEEKKAYEVLKGEYLNIYVNLILNHIDKLNYSIEGGGKNVELIFDILISISKYTINVEEGNQLLNVLSTYLSPKFNYISMRRKSKMISIFQYYSMNNIINSPENYMENLSFQLLSVSDGEIRKQILELFHSQSFLLHLNKFQYVVEALEDLNSYSKNMINEYDFDRRFKGYTQFIQHLTTFPSPFNSYSFYSIHSLATPPPPPPSSRKQKREEKKEKILGVIFYPMAYNLLFNIQDNDVSVRTNAFECMVKLLQYLSDYVTHLKHQLTQQNMNKMEIMNEIELIEKIPKNLINSWVKRMIKNKNQLEVNYKIYLLAIQLFSYCIQYFPSIYPDLQCLIKPNWNFFYLLSSNSYQDRLKSILTLKRLINPNKKSKALKKLTKNAEDQENSKEMQINPLLTSNQEVQDIERMLDDEEEQGKVNHNEIAFGRRIRNKSYEEFILPVLFYFIFHFKGSGGGGSGAGSSGSGNNSTMIDECIQVVSFVTYYLPWNSYYRTLSSLLNQLHSTSNNKNKRSKHKLQHNPSHQKNIIKLSCKILDCFHFLQLSTNDPENQLFNPTSTEDAMEISALPALNAPLHDEEDDEHDEPASDDENEEEENETDKKEGEGEGGEEENDKELENLVEEEEEGNEEAAKEKKEDEVEGKNKEEEKKKKEINTSSKSSGGGAGGGEIEVGERIKKEDKIIDILVRQVIPRLIDNMRMDNNQISNNIEISLTIVKILKLLPQTIIRREMNKLVIKIVNNLRSREEKIREDTRATLIKVVEAAGVEYLFEIVREMKLMLNRGYQMQILGYTIHHLFIHMDQQGILTEECKNLNNKTLEILSSILIEDILGETSEKKEVEKIKKSMKESKSIRSYSTYEILSKYIEFSESIDILLTPIYQLIIHKQSNAVVKKIIKILEHISVGLSKNNKIKENEILIFIYTLISQNIQNFEKEREVEWKGRKINQLNEKKSAKNQEKIARLGTMSDKYERTYKVLAGPRDLLEKRRMNEVNKSNLHIFAEFSLNLFHSLLKKSKFNLKDEKQVEMIDPFIELLLESMKSSNEKTIELSIKCLCKLLENQSSITVLPSIRSNLNKINKKIFKLIQKTSSKSKIMEFAFKLQILFVKNYLEIIEFLPGQLEYLIVKCENDLQLNKNSQLIFSFIKTIIHKKQFISVEIYKIMKKISELVIDSPSLSHRSNCSSILIEFLLYYPLSKERLQQQIDYLLKHLNSQSPDTRKSILNIFSSIIQQFPADFIEQQCEYFYFNFILNLINDEDQVSRELSSNVIKLLLNKLKLKQLNSIYQLTKKWFSDSSNLPLQRAASQVFATIFIEINDFLVHFPDFIDVLLNNLIDESEFHFRNKDHSSDLEYAENFNEFVQNQPKKWHSIYFNLIGIEKLFKLHPNFILQAFDKKTAPQFFDIQAKFNVDFWWKLVNLLLHSHNWVRMAVNRIFGLSFASLKSPKQLEALFASSKKAKVSASPAEKSSLIEFLKTGGVGRLFTKKLTSQMYSQYLSPEYSDQIVKNLLFVSIGLFYAPSFHKQALLRPVFPSFLKFSSFLDEEDVQNQPSDEEGDRAVQDEENEEEVIPEDVIADSTSKIDENSQENQRQLEAVHWVFRKLSFTARRSSKYPETVSFFPLPSPFTLLLLSFPLLLLSFYITSPFFTLIITIAPFLPLSFIFRIIFLIFFFDFSNTEKMHFQILCGYVHSIIS